MYNIKYYNLRKKINLILFLLPIICLCSKIIDYKDKSDKSEESNWNIVQTSLGFPVIADIRDDGVSRAYGIEGGGDYQDNEGYLYEYKYSDGSWVKNLILTKLFRKSAPLIAAKCRGDDQYRLYGYCSEGIFEVEYKNDTWSQRIVHDGGQCIIKKGVIRNDNFESLIIYYSREGELGELSYREGEWIFFTIADTLCSFSSEPSCEHGIAVGNIKGSSGDCIYIINGQSVIFEYSYKDMAKWQVSVVDTIDFSGPNSFWDPEPCIGIFPDFDSQSLFATLSGLYQYKYNGSWVKKKVVEYTPNFMEAGIGQDDGVYRLYCCGWFGALCEVSKTGDSFMITDQLEIEPGNALEGLSIGPGRGDGVHRIYAEQFQGFDPFIVYELTYKN